MRAAKEALDSPSRDSPDTLRAAHSALLSISRITLSHFRNYESARLVAGASPIILTGANGGGKTNLLEAISLLVPGRGLRHAALADLQRRDTSEPWAVAIDLRAHTGVLSIGTGRDNAVNDSEGERRVVHIDGKPARSQNLLAEHIALAWLTPDMDRLLCEGASGRRRFLDRLAFSFDPAHGGRVRAYEKAMRERLRLLRDGSGDSLWLSSLENEMAQRAVAIAAARREMVAHLQTKINESIGAFPQAVISIQGTAEDMLESAPALIVEDALRAAFEKARPEDAQTGACATGAHRSDLRVTHRAKNCPAELCSTGEQKALIIAIMLAYVRLLAGTRGMKPLLLLDDCAAHLDDFRRDALFDEILSLKIQAWFTGTDSSFFTRLSPCAEEFRIENGVIH